MMHFLKGGNWQDGEGMDFLGFTKMYRGIWPLVERGY